METICQLASDDVQHLIDINDVANLLGITRQGAYKLIEREESFPTPEVRVTAGSIWRTEEVEHWLLTYGHRRSVNLLVEPGDPEDPDKPDKFERFRLVQSPTREDLGRIEVVIPTDDIDRYSELRWAKKLGRLEDSDRLNPARRYIPLTEWDQRMTPGGQAR